MKILFTNQAQKDYEKLRNNKALFKKALMLIKIISENPYQNPPAYEKLFGELYGAYSRMINKQHRLVYRIVENEVWIISMWTHYEF